MPISTNSVPLKSFKLTPNNSVGPTSFVLINSDKLAFLNPELEFRSEIDSKIFVFPEPFFPEIKTTFFSGLICKKL